MKIREAEHEEGGRIAGFRLLGGSCLPPLWRSKGSGIFWLLFPSKLFLSYCKIAHFILS